MAGYVMSPDEVEQYRRQGGRFGQLGTDASPVGHWTQALARVLQGGVGSMYQSQAAEGEKLGRDSARQTLAAAMMGNDPMKVAQAGVSNPWVGQQGMQLGQMMASQQQAAASRAQQERMFRAQSAQQERMLGLQNQYQLALARAKDEMEVESLKRRARALGLPVDEPAPAGPMPSTPAGGARAAAEAPQAAPDVGPVQQPAAPPDVYGQLVQPPRPAAEVEADRKRRAAQAMVLGDVKGAQKILNKDEDPKEYQTKDASWAERMARAEITLRGNIGTPDAPTYNPGQLTNKFWPDDSIFNSEKWRTYQGGAREWIAALLRKDTGAAVTQSEWDLYFPTYFAQPGDSAEVQRQKMERRIQTARGLRASSGPAFERMFPSFDAEMGQRLRDQQSSAAGTKAPSVGTVQDGYRFRGGDPANPQSWERVR